MLANDKLICPNCKNELPQDSEFCQYCGGKIEIPVVESDTNKVEIKGEDLAEDIVTPIDENETAARILSSGIIEGQKAVDANKESQPHHELDTDFGLVPQKPVYTVGIDEQEKYLKSLRTINGEPIKWNYRGSMSVNEVHGMVDVYDIYLMSGAEYKTIYINMYGARNSTMAPSGFVLMTQAPISVKAPKQKEPKVRKSKKPVNKKLVVCLTVIPIAVIIVALLAVFVLIPGLKYNHAKNLLENGNYELAYSEFEKLDGYADSENMLLECRYVQAIKYRDAGDYELANKIFESLGNYRDSKILIHKHDYKVSNTVAATCTVAGSETYKCSGCDDSYTKTYTKAEHNYKLVSTVVATCTVEGSETYKCTTCDDGYMKTVGKVNHSYSLFSSKDATCTTAGSNSFKCSGCEHIYSVISEQLTHNYKAISTQVPTCQKEGYTTYKCSLCNDEYTETQGKTSHDTFLASTNDSTCTALGSENYECKNCTYTYAEEIAKKSHNYTDATCTAPKTCDMCGKTEGQKLGHSNNLICTRCGESTFEKLVISGVGNKYYTDFDIPGGTYNITFNISSGNYVYIYINGSSIASGGGEMITQKYISGRKNAILHISASSSAQWTITIEAVGN